MKKLLIIQLDEAYFLFESLLMLEHHWSALKDFEVTVLVNQISLKQIQDGSVSIPPGITTSVNNVLNQQFDLSVNFSLNEDSWSLHQEVNSSQKLGCLKQDGKLNVPDAWSSYLLTLKSRAPFLTFHLQDIYKNILGIRKMSQSNNEKKTYSEVFIGLSNTSFFSAIEQEKLIGQINSNYPNIKIKDISEVDFATDHSHSLYIGPASLDALKICEDGATGIYLSSQFQGFNLLPHNSGHFLISARNTMLKSDSLMSFIDAHILNKNVSTNFPYALYQIDCENLFGSYIKSLNLSDDCYPLYQAHVVLWNFVLNLFDLNLEIIKCSQGHTQLLETQREVLMKVIRLYDYAMSSIDFVHKESKSVEANFDKLQGHLKNLRDIDEITDKISQSHAYLRPILDFYRIRRGQNEETTLYLQAQHSYLLYSEEHQALKSILELITVTLRKNDVSI